MTIDEELNEIAQSIAERRGIQPAEALAEFKKNYLHRSQVLDAISDLKEKPTTPRILDLLGSGKNDDISIAVTEQSKIEMQRLKIEERRLAAEDRKAELAERRLQIEERYREEQTRIDRERQREDANFNKLQLMMQSGNAKNEDMMKLLFNLKNQERDREMDIKTALAKIEADRDVELGKLKQEADAETASQMDMLINKMDEKFGSRIEKMPNSADSFITQMQEYKKMQDQFLTLTIDTLEARGFDKDQISIMKKAAKIEEAKQDTTVDKVWEVGKKIWKDYVEPNIDKAQRELSPPPQQQYSSYPSGLEATSEQIEQQREYQRRMAAEQERIRIETLRKQEENARLQAQLEQERQIHAQRQHLEDRAIQLGIVIDPAMIDRQISDAIVRQEFILEQVRAEREKLEVQAFSVGITLDPSLTNEQVFDMIEHREANLENIRAVQLKQESEEKRRRELISKSIDLGISFDRNISNEEIAALIEKQEAIMSEECEEEAKKTQIDPIEPDIVAEKTIPDAQPAKRCRKQKPIQKFIVTKEEDGTVVGEVDARDARGAALSVAGTLGGTVDSPVRVKVTKEGTEGEKTFETLTAEAQVGDRKPFQRPLARAVKSP